MNATSYEPAAATGRVYFPAASVHTPGSVVRAPPCAYRYTHTFAIGALVAASVTTPEIAVIVIGVVVVVVDVEVVVDVVLLDVVVVVGTVVVDVVVVVGTVVVDVVVVVGTVVVDVVVVVVVVGEVQPPHGA